MTTTANAKLAGHFLPTPSLPRQRRRLFEGLTNRASYDGLFESVENHFKLKIHVLVEAESGLAFESLLFVPESHL